MSLEKSSRVNKPRPDQMNINQNQHLQNCIIPTYCPVPVYCPTYYPVYVPCITPIYYPWPCYEPCVYPCVPVQQQTNERREQPIRYRVESPDVVKQKQNRNFTIVEETVKESVKSEEKEEIRESEESVVRVEEIIRPRPITPAPRPTNYIINDDSRFSNFEEFSENKFKFDSKFSSDEFKINDRIGSSGNLFRINSNKNIFDPENYKFKKCEEENTSSSLFESTSSSNSFRKESSFASSFGDSYAQNFKRF